MKEDRKCTNAHISFRIRFARRRTKDMNVSQTFPYHKPSRLKRSSDSLPAVSIVSRTIAVYGGVEPSRAGRSGVHRGADRDTPMHGSGGGNPGFKYVRGAAIEKFIFHQCASDKSHPGEAVHTNPSHSTLPRIKSFPKTKRLQKRRIPPRFHSPRPRNDPRAILFRCRRQNRDVHLAVIRLALYHVPSRKLLISAENVAIRAFADDVRPRARDITVGDHAERFI